MKKVLVLALVFVAFLIWVNKFSVPPWPVLGGMETIQDDRVRLRIATLLPPAHHVLADGIQYDLYDSHCRALYDWFYDCTRPQAMIMF